MIDKNKIEPISNGMHNLEHKIEAVLFFKNEPVAKSDLAKILAVSAEEVEEALNALEESYKNRGIVLLRSGGDVALGTHPELSELIEGVVKEELSRELGKAGIETLSIILYKHPISRKEVDYIRGVNSTFILRNLMIRGLIERTSSTSGERSHSYKPTLKLLEHLGITRIEELPRYEETLEKLDKFATTETEDE